MIGRFIGKDAFLSNFYPSTIYYKGEWYPTVEHAYQAAKTFDKGERKEIQYAGSPSHAKSIGRSATLRADWEDVKLDIMEEIIRKKFAHGRLRKMLVMTGDQMLVEGNDWGDTFWGVCKGRGSNHLGKILMKVRDEFSSKGLT